MSSCKVWNLAHAATSYTTLYGITLALNSYSSKKKNFAFDHSIVIRYYVKFLSNDTIRLDKF